MMLSLDTAYRSFSGEVEASSTPTICRLSDSSRHQLSAIAPPGADDQLDKPAQTILQLVAQAAGMADENSRHALGMAQKLSDQLREAEDRVAELVTELTASRERADRAEQWLHRIYGEIEDRFLQQG